MNMKLIAALLVLLVIVCGCCYRGMCKGTEKFEIDRNVLFTIKDDPMFENFADIDTEPEQFEMTFEPADIGTKVWMDI